MFLTITNWFDALFLRLPPMLVRISGHAKSPEEQVATGAWFRRWLDVASMRCVQLICFPISVARTLCFFAVAKSIRDNFVATKFLETAPREFRGERLSVALHVHVVDLDDEILEDVCNAVAAFPAESLIVITTGSVERQARLQRAIEGIGRTAEILVVPEVLSSAVSLLTYALPRLQGVDLFCHLHTSNVGEELAGCRRKYQFRNLVGSPHVVDAIATEFAGDSALGAVFPPPYPTTIDKPTMRVPCRKITKWFRELESITGSPVSMEGKPLSIGDMFWCRIDAVRPLLDRRVQATISESPLTADTAEAINHCWGPLVAGLGFRSQMTIVNERSERTVRTSVKRLLIFVSFHPEGVVTPAVERLLRELRNETTKTIIIFNGALRPDQQDRLKDVDEVMQRENRGYDFGAWREVLLSRDRSEFLPFDEIILANDSVVCSGRSIGGMFAEMEKRECDFWGVTQHPEILVLGTGWEPELTFGDKLQSHLQSYFLVFRRNAIASDFFWDYWRNLPIGSSYAQVVIHNEVLTTARFEQQGFKRDCYLRESIEMESRPILNQFYLAEHNLLLGSPFLKRKFLKRATKERLELIASKLPADVR